MFNHLRKRSLTDSAFVSPCNNVNEALDTRDIKADTSIFSRLDNIQGDSRGKLMKSIVKEIKCTYLCYLDMLDFISTKEKVCLTRCTQQLFFHICGINYGPAIAALICCKLVQLSEN